MFEDDLEKPVTRGEFLRVTDQMKQSMEQLRSEMNHGYRDLADQIMSAVTTAETRLLNAFYGYADTNNKRMVSVESSQDHLRSRISSVEDRLLAVERKLNMPPAS